MTRRGLFGRFFGALAVAKVAPAAVDSMRAALTSNTFCKWDWITREELTMLYRNIEKASSLNVAQAHQFKIGETIVVKMPQRYRAVAQ